MNSISFTLPSTGRRGNPAEPDAKHCTCTTAELLAAEEEHPLPSEHFICEPDEQTLAATEAAAEKTKLAEELAKRTSGDRKAEENLRQAVTNAEKENLKLNDKLAQVLSEKETLNTELRTIAAEVGDVKVRTYPQCC